MGPAASPNGVIWPFCAMCRATVHVWGMGGGLRTDSGVADCGLGARGPPGPGPDRG